MSDQMYLFRIIVLIQLSLIQCTEYKQLSGYLTLNKSQQWLRNQTQKSSSGNPYCLICCMNIKENSVGKVCGKHTMCIFEDKPGPLCKGFISIRFTKDEITAIVDIHNTLRNFVATGSERRGDPGPQPRASNMRMIEWDEELALLANRWALQCVLAHDICRDLAKYPVGQNIAKGNYALNNDLSFVVEWFDAVTMFGYDELISYRLKKPKSYPSPTQYTQLVWAESYKIGCARIAFQRTDGSNMTYREHFICNYGPAGNIPGQPVYKIGTPCSECPAGTGCAIEYPGLCSGELIHDMKYLYKASKKNTHDSSHSSGVIDDRLVVKILFLNTVASIIFF